MSKRAPEGNPTASLRLIDGGITCNNPADVAVHEARLLFGRERRLAVVSVGTGTGAACEASQNSYLPSWLQNLVSATGDVAQTDATVRHLLSPADAYFRLAPTSDAFSVQLDDSREGVMHELTKGAEAFMDTPAARALVARLVVAVLPRGAAASAGGGGGHVSGGV